MFTHTGGPLPRALNSAVREVIELRISQLRRNYDGPLDDIVAFHVVEAGDGQSEVRAALGFSPLENFVDGTTFGESDFQPNTEWIACHGSFFELVYILTDDGFGTILFVPNDPGTEFDLHSMCLEFACC